MNTIPARASRTQRTTQDDIDEVPDSYYDTRLPTSARRYVDTHGNRVIQQGNRRIVIHEEPPPKKPELEVDPTVAKRCSVSGRSSASLRTLLTMSSMAAWLAPGGPWTLM